MNRNLLVFLLLIPFTLVHWQCQKPKSTPRIDPAFAGYITAFTSGMVSNNTTVKIRLTEPYADAEPGKQVEKKLFEFAPDIEGTVFWIDTQTLEFRPKSRLVPGKLYEGRFFLSKLMKVPVALETLVFQFHVRQQALEVTFGGVESYDTYDLKWQIIHGSAITYDYADGELVEKSVTALQNGKPLPVLWEHDEDGRTHRFRLDSIRRTEQRQAARF
jgi:hypothetical protein